VREFYTAIVWGLVTAPPNPLPTQQNGGQNRDKAYYNRRALTRVCALARSDLKREGVAYKKWSLK
jgi:hypothetical protein